MTNADQTVYYQDNFSITNPTRVVQHIEGKMDGYRSPKSQ